MTHDFQFSMNKLTASYSRPSEHSFMNVILQRAILFCVVYTANLPLLTARLSNFKPDTSFQLLSVVIPKKEISTVSPNVDRQVKRGFTFGVEQNSNHRYRESASVISQVTTTSSLWQLQQTLYPETGQGVGYGQAVALSQYHGNTFAYVSLPSTSKNEIAESHFL